MGGSVGSSRRSQFEGLVRLRLRVIGDGESHGLGRRVVLLCGDTSEIRHRVGEELADHGEIAARAGMGISRAADRNDAEADGPGRGLVAVRGRRHPDGGGAGVFGQFGHHRVAARNLIHDLDDHPDRQAAVIVPDRDRGGGRGGQVGVGGATKPAHTRHRDGDVARGFGRRVLDGRDAHDPDGFSASRTAPAADVALDVAAVRKFNGRRRPLVAGGDHVPRLAHGVGHEVGGGCAGLGRDIQREGRRRPLRHRRGPRRDAHDPRGLLLSGRGLDQTHGNQVADRGAKGTGVGPEESASSGIGGIEPRLKTAAHAQRQIVAAAFLHGGGKLEYVTVPGAMVIELLDRVVHFSKGKVVVGEVSSLGEEASTVIALYHSGAVGSDGQDGRPQSSGAGRNRHESGRGGAPDRRRRTGFLGVDRRDAVVTRAGGREAGVGVLGSGGPGVGHQVAPARAGVRGDLDPVAGDRRAPDARRRGPRQVDPRVRAHGRGQVRGRVRGGPKPDPVIGAARHGRMGEVVRIGQVEVVVETPDANRCGLGVQPQSVRLNRDAVGVLILVRHRIAELAGGAGSGTMDPNGASLLAADIELYQPSGAID